MQAGMTGKSLYKVLLALLTVIMLVIPEVNAEVRYGRDLDDLSGTWKGWGRVTLKKKSDDIYVGIYTNTSRRGGTGVLRLSFKSAKGFGNWFEIRKDSDKKRGGQLYNIVVSEGGRKITGYWNTTEFDYGRYVKKRRFTWRR